MQLNQIVQIQVAEETAQTQLKIQPSLIILIPRTQQT